MSQEPSRGDQNIYVHAQSLPQSNGFAIASLVLGILSIVCAFIPVLGLTVWIIAPLGLVFGLVALTRPAGKGMAIGGSICSGIGLLICVLGVISLANIMAARSNATVSDTAAEAREPAI